MNDQPNNNSNPANGEGDNATTSSQKTGGGQNNGSITPGKNIETELQEAKSRLAEMTQFATQALADLQNFKRRADEEKSSFLGFANAALLTELIPVIDNTHRSLEHEPKDAEWAKGVETTLRQFIQTLEKIGLKNIETKDQVFDPKFHDALLTGPGKKDMVLQEFEKGYLLNEKVLKRARVKVGNGEEV